jgi:hypothetical protein
MKRFTFALVVVALTASAAYATAGPVTRTGSDYDGISNPRSCEIMVENGTELHVMCRASVGATGAARIRWRFTKQYGGVRAPATVSADLKNGCAVVRWMAPVRTLRVLVPFGCYEHIVSVTWRQP